MARFWSVVTSLLEVGGLGSIIGGTFLLSFDAGLIVAGVVAVLLGITLGPDARTPTE